MLEVMNASLPTRSPCPPGACDCGRDTLQDSRILLLTRQEEKRLLERLENVKSLEDLQHMQRKLFENLGIRLQINPSYNEVRTMRGFNIQIEALPGLCRKTRQSIPAAVRRALERQPEIAYRLLDAQDLLRDA